MLYGLELRKPLFNNKFYPGNSSTLKSMLKKLMDNNKNFQNNIKGVIVPHAGYRFSGKIAAKAYSKIDPDKYETIIIVGPSHRKKIQNIIVSDSDQWETPLGRVSVNKKIARDVTNKFDNIICDANKFSREHSHEVQLPFLQYLSNNDFKIVPIMINNYNLDKKLSKILNYINNKYSEVLFVFSTDLSHYHNYNKAKIMDKKSINFIENKNYNLFKKSIRKGECELCGAPGVLAAIKFSRKNNYDIEFIDYKNSGDIISNQKSVVGYGSFIIKDTKKVSKTNKLSKKLKKRMISISRKTLKSYVKTKKIPNFNINSSYLKKKRGVFVTLKKNQQLRGCIGSIYPKMKLYRGIIKMTVAAATRDYRFNSVKKDELENIQIEISVLSKPKKISDIEQIKMGKHGVIVEKNNKSGVYLPQVGKETGWKKLTFLRHLCKNKAGLDPDAWKDAKTNIYIFTARVIKEARL